MSKIVPALAAADPAPAPASPPPKASNQRFLLVAVGAVVALIVAFYVQQTIGQLQRELTRVQTELETRTRHHVVTEGSSAYPFPAGQCVHPAIVHVPRTAGR